MIKKLLLFSLTASVTTLIIVSSCRKGTPLTLGNWVCHCSMTNNSGTYTADDPELNMTQGDATNKCADDQVSRTSATTTAACQLRQQQ